MTTPALRLVNPETGELHSSCPNCKDLEATVDGHEITLRKQSQHIGRLERDIKRYAEAEATHPQNKEIVGLVEHWRRVTHHPKSKISEDRIKLVRARIKDGYSIEQIRLALDGLAANPYVVNAQRRPHGKPSQRFDQMKHALSGGEKLEALANLAAISPTQKEQ